MRINTVDAVKTMLSASGVTMAQASRMAGRSDRFAANTLARGGSMQADTLAGLAAPCGYAVALVPAGSVPAGSIVIDPPAPSA